MTKYEIRGVLALHDLHVWTITTGLDSLSAHVVVSPGTDADALLARIQHVLHERFGIEHVTIQIESEAFGAHPSHA